ncbi:STAS domain-containing protein [Desulfonema magnum]|uniref:STAS domain-containing protein n=1 Tax=Desulfonema magnum TaxID=45655 RepID=A0A975BYD0_9BACT|nr:STAS domain-containing protein [Desulfonema magnum]QTA93830.1 STAS domain-containing protein [Desulfonema magnum]
MMELNVTQDRQLACFEIRGDIDEPGAEDLKQRFRELHIPSLREVTFDFKNVSHIGSAGIGKLLLFYKDLALNGGRIKIENVSETVYELFGVLKLDTIFTISKR